MDKNADPIKSRNSGQPSKAETISRILSAATLEFSRCGLARARMDEIARQASVTKQLLYHYYGSKKELFLAVLKDRSDKVIADFRKLDLVASPPPEAMRRFLEFTADQYILKPHTIGLAQEAIAYHNESEPESSRFVELAPLIVEKLAELLTRGQMSGHFRHDVDPKYFSAMSSLIIMGGFTNSYTRSSLIGFDTTSPEGMILWRNYAVNFVMNAILLDSPFNGSAIS